MAGIDAMEEGTVGIMVDEIPTGALLWLKADAGVIEDGNVVLTWQDQSGNNNHANRGSTAAPHLATVSFPSGDLPSRWNQRILGNRGQDRWGTRGGDR